MRHDSRPAMPVPNIELLDRVLAQIEEYPDQWNQDVWRCGTTYCFAGWACQMTGAQWAQSASAGCPPDWVVADDQDDLGTACIDDLGRKVIEPGRRARRLLGLTVGEGVRLFLDCDTLAEIRAVVADIKARA